MVNSDMQNFVPIPAEKGREQELIFSQTFRFEGMLPCHATTPLGHAIACPMLKNICQPRKFPHDNTTYKLHDHGCDTVYVGHNMLGNELHWLPNEYLISWWKRSPWHKIDLASSSVSSVADQLAHRFQHDHDESNIRPKPSKPCPNDNYTHREYRKYYQHCLWPKQAATDQHAQTIFGSSSATADTNTTSTATNYAQLYASLPVLRVTMLRDPWSWLMSRFFWQSTHMGQTLTAKRVKPFRGKSVEEYMRNHWPPKLRQEWEQQMTNATMIYCDDVVEAVHGWAHHAALEYIFYLCGEHSLSQFVELQGNRDIEREYVRVVEEQAEYNLRNSFAVVGLLNEAQGFFDMITHRVSYMDMSLHPHVQGTSHTSGNGMENRRCKDIWKQPEFQEEIMAGSPAIATLHRLYQVGLQVNAHQKAEIQQCKATSSTN